MNVETKVNVIRNPDARECDASIIAMENRDPLPPPTSDHDRSNNHVHGLFGDMVRLSDSKLTIHPYANPFLRQPIIG